MVEVGRVVDARGPQGVALQVQRLGAVGLRDAGVADQGRRARHAVRPKGSACRSSRLARGRSTVENAVGRAAAAWPSDTLTGGRVRRLASTSRPTTASASPARSPRPPSSGYRFRAAASGPWPPSHGGRTVRPPSRCGEAWSTGAEVAGAPSQTRRPPPRRLVGQAEGAQLRRVPAMKRGARRSRRRSGHGRGRPPRTPRPGRVAAAVNRWRGRQRDPPHRSPRLTPDPAGIPGVDSHRLSAPPRWFCLRSSGNPARSKWSLVRHAVDASAALKCFA